MYPSQYGYPPYPGMRSDPRIQGSISMINSSPWAAQSMPANGYPGYFSQPVPWGSAIKVGHESHLFPDAQILKERQRKQEEYRSDEAKLKRKKEAIKQKELVKKNMKTVGLQVNDVLLDKKKIEEEKRRKALAKHPPPFDFSRIGIASGGTGMPRDLFSQSPYPVVGSAPLSANPSIYPIMIPPLADADKVALSPNNMEHLINGSYKVWKVYTLLKFWETHQKRCKAALKNNYFAEYYKKDGNAFLDQSIEMIKTRIKLILAEVIQDDKLDLARDSIRLQQVVTLILNEFDDICSAPTAKKFDNMLVLSFLSNICTSGSYIPAKGFLTKYVTSKLNINSTGQLQ